jgi:Na+-translocating ferredoxin:NAD+ oxidoreductase subunit B
MQRKAVALIDESRCIGCTRCIDACPVDAVVGAQSLMHTVVEPWCIGCGLCPPACPVDCIEMAPARGRWTALLKKAAGERGRRRQARLKRPYASATPQRRRRVLAEILARRR